MESRRLGGGQRKRKYVPSDWMHSSAPMSTMPYLTRGLPSTSVSLACTGRRIPLLKQGDFARSIRAHAAQRHVTVADVVQAAGCSRRYVEQHFRAQLHASVRDIILQTKLERVRTLLEESNFSIGEIAAQCGAANESHLAVLFKKATGLSMRDYRKQNREPADD